MHTLPKQKFSNWHRWEDRDQIEDSHLAGVYALAKFKRPFKGKINLQDKNIIYFGETCLSLRSRWRRFDRSAFQGRTGHTGHSGGHSYRLEMGDKGEYLYVSAMPIKLDKNISRLFIRFLERKLILYYALENGFPPCLNKK